MVTWINVEKNFMTAFYISFTAIVFITCLLYCYLIIMDHKKRMAQDLKSWDEICEKYADVSILRKSFVVLLERRFSYIRNYFLFQILNKGFGFLGISYSLMGIVILLFENMYSLSILISFSSVVCVVIALYLSPNIRVIQYISVWRKCDNKIMETFSVIVECNGNIDRIQKCEMEIAKLLNECENELTCDSE